MVDPNYIHMQHFVLSFMLQILYLHIFGRTPGETDFLPKKAICHKKIPPHHKPKDSRINMQYFPNLFVLLGALNVRFYVKHKSIVFNYSHMLSKLGQIE